MRVFSSLCRRSGAVCFLTPATRKLGKKRLEGHVAKRFGYIIITATVFWAPLFIVLVLNMCEDSQTEPTLAAARAAHVRAGCDVCSCSCRAAYLHALHRQLRSQLHKLLHNTLIKIS